MRAKRAIGLILGAVLGFMLSTVPALAQSTQCISNALAGGTANAITIPLLPCSSATNLLLLTISTTNTGAVTLQQQGGSALPLDDATGAPLIAGALQAGSVVLLSSTGTKWLLLTSSIGGGNTGVGKVLSVSGNYTVTAADVTNGVFYLDVNAASGPVTITVPPALSNSSTTPMVVVSKTDTTNNIITISDGTNSVDYIVSGAGANGQINGYRDIYSNGTNLRSEGAG